MKKKIITGLVAILMTSITAFSQDIPEHVQKLATAMGIVYVGMPKEDLYKTGFTRYMQKGYRQEGNEEWITFLDYMTEEPGDTITFYLKDGKVAGWKKPGAKPGETVKPEI